MIAWHHEQSTPSSCVAACVCIVRRFRGEPITPADQAADATPRRAHLGTIRGLGRVSSIGDEPEIRIALARGHIVVAQVLGHPYVSWLNAKHGALRSRHPPMCAPGNFDGPPHAVVIVGADTNGLRILDPYFPANGQPLHMTYEDFQRCFGGLAYDVEP